MYLELQIDTYYLDPNILPLARVDSGAIRSIINGADVMAPGLTSSASHITCGLKPDNFIVRTKSYILNLHFLNCRPFFPKTKIMPCVLE